jgi:phosphatidylserine decarboxylase
MGFVFRASFSRVLIRPLAKIYHISLDTYEIPEDGFRTLNEFFIRPKKSSFLEFPQETSLGSPADACVEVFRDITLNDAYCIKGYRAKLVDIF